MKYVVFNGTTRVHVEASDELQALVMVKRHFGLPSIGPLVLFQRTGEDIDGE